MTVAVAECGDAKRRDDTQYTHPADTKSVGVLYCAHATSPPPPLPGQTDILKICLKFFVARIKKPAQRDMSFALRYDLSGWSKIVYVCCN